MARCSNFYKIVAIITIAYSFSPETELILPRYPDILCLSEYIADYKEFQAVYLVKLPVGALWCCNIRKFRTYATCRNLWRSDIWPGGFGAETIGFGVVICGYGDNMLHVAYASMED